MRSDSGSATALVGGPPERLFCIFACRLLEDGSTKPLARSARLSYISMRQASFSTLMSTHHSNRPTLQRLWPCRMLWAENASTGRSEARDPPGRSPAGSDSPNPFHPFKPRTQHHSLKRLGAALQWAPPRRRRMRVTSDPPLGEGDSIRFGAPLTACFEVESREVWWGRQCGNVRRLLRCPSTLTLPVSSLCVGHVFGTRGSSIKFRAWG